VYPARSSTGTATLSGAAPAGGPTWRYRSNNTAVARYRQRDGPGRDDQATFPITTTAVEVNTVTITAATTDQDSDADGDPAALS